MDREPSKKDLETIIERMYDLEVPIKKHNLEDILSAAERVWIEHCYSAVFRDIYSRPGEIVTIGDNDEVDDSQKTPNRHQG